MKKSRQNKSTSSGWHPATRSMVQQVSTVHGWAWARGAGPAGRAWRLLLLADLLATAAFLAAIRDRYTSDRILTQINANCKIQQVPFPAVSICNLNLISLREVANVVTTLKRNKKSETEINDFLKNLPNLQSYQNIQGNISNLVDTMNILKKNFYTIDTLMEEVHQKCENLLVRCLFNGKQFECRDMFRLTKTLEGYCCTFNYHAVSDDGQQSVADLLFQMFSKEYTPDWEYYIDTDDGEPTNIISTSEFGRSSGLSVVFNVEPSDYPEWTPTQYYGAKLLLSDPNDYPETTVLSRLAAPGAALDLKVRPLVLQAEPALRGVAAARRGCWFHDELRLATTARYSFETCRSECRMATFRALCGCLPYKYPREKATRVCSFEDLKCLHNVTVSGVSDGAACPYVCYPECLDKKYSMTSDAVPLTRRDTHGINMSVSGGGGRTPALAAARVYFSKATCSCYKMMLLMDFNYFIATYGGVFSLSFGGSLITIFELVYLIVTALVAWIRPILFSSKIQFYN